MAVVKGNITGKYSDYVAEMTEELQESITKGINDNIIRKLKELGEGKIILFENVDNVDIQKK